ncbi:MAG: hypothetical protein U0836_11080 [Pirellulales bacterium]
MKLPRFSLRLLLVAVALFCAWLAWERSVVVQRQAVRRELENRGAVFWEAFDFPAATPGPGKGARRMAGPKKPSSFRAWLRSNFGDQEIDYVFLPRDNYEELCVLTEGTFPEAGAIEEPPEIPDFPVGHSPFAPAWNSP